MIFAAEALTEAEWSRQFSAVLFELFLVSVGLFLVIWVVAFCFEMAARIWDLFKK